MMECAVKHKKEYGGDVVMIDDKEREVFHADICTATYLDMKKPELNVLREKGIAN